jgi:thiol-disulfide isomerase/thioredoxin
MGQTSEMAVIKGKISTKSLPNEIALCSISNGALAFHSKVKIASDSTFCFSFLPKYSGLYCILNRFSVVHIYLTPGKQISIVITDSGFSVLNTSDIENNKLAEWNKVIGKLIVANSINSTLTYKDIFPLLPELETKKDSFLANSKTGNNAFDRLIKGMAQAQFEYELYHLLLLPRLAKPITEEIPSVYDRISTGLHFETTDVLNYDFGQAAISSYLQYLWSINYKEGYISEAEQKDKLCIDHIKNDTLKGWYFISNYLIKSISYDQVYRDRFEKYKGYILSETQKKKIHDLELSIRKLGDNEPAIEFAGTTVEGKKVALSDFKGKVVVVDVWATWCGPCKKEIPSLQKLEDEMTGKDVVFMSFSIDEIKDKNKWVKFVADHNLGGVQLIGDAGVKSGLCVEYKIYQIPRFMVFDKLGLIATIDAPRPSTPELKVLIEKLLKY